MAGEFGGGAHQAVDEREYINARNTITASTHCSQSLIQVNGPNNPSSREEMRLYSRDREYYLYPANTGASHRPGAVKGGCVRRIREY